MEAADEVDAPVGGADGEGGRVRWVDGRNEMALVDLVNRVVDRGVVISGEVVVSVAGVDLLHLELKLLLASPDRIRRESEP